MRRAFAVLSLILWCALCAHGQGATGQMSAQGTTCAVSGACVVTPTIPPSAGAAAFTISGNAGGNTIQFEASADSQTSWVALNVTPTNSTTAVTSATGNGTWQANVAGYTNVRLRTSTYVSGTPQGTINISYASARSGGGGGGGGSGTVTSVTIAGTANQVTASGTCTITISGTCTLSQPNAVILGTDNSAAGTEQLANGSANAHTILASGATTSNTIKGFATAPTTGDVVTCTTASTTCTLTDSGVTTPSAAGTGVLTQTIASGTAALGTGAISSGTCATVVTVAGTGIATTDDIMADFNADPTSTTGYSPSANGMLTIVKYPTSGNVNFKVCNNTASSITPGAVTLNWRVVR